MNLELQDYSHSQAILIGVSHYIDPGFPPLPAAANSLDRLNEILVNTYMCGWPSSKVTVLRDPTDVRRVAQQVRRLAQEARDVLLIYYVGHGTVTPMGELCLTLQDTDPSDPDITGLEYSRVKKALLDSPARMKVVVLDCCYSGRAIEALADPAAVVADSTDTHGVYTLTASDNAAHVVPFAQQSNTCTSFTGEFIDLIRSGIPDAPGMLTLGLIYFHLRQRLRSRGLPVPNQRGTDTADMFPFVRNIGAAPKPRRPLHQKEATRSSSVNPLTSERPRGRGNARWTLLNTLQQGQLLAGTISSIFNYGAFVDIGGMTGLVHVSELSWNYVGHPKEVIELGQKVTVKVIGLDIERERVSLSLKATQNDPWPRFVHDHEIGEVLPGKVTRLAHYGAFVQVAEGIEGLLHISQLADSYIDSPEEVVQVGDEIFVEIISVEFDRRRLGLSLDEDEWIDQDSGFEEDSYMGDPDHYELARERNRARGLSSPRLADGSPSPDEAWAPLRAKLSRGWGQSGPKIRIYELAKELGIESKSLMARLQEMGEFVRSPSSTVEVEIVYRLIGEVDG